METKYLSAEQSLGWKLETGLGRYEGKETERQRTRSLVIEVSLLKHRGSLGLGTKRSHKPAEGALWTAHSSRKSKPSRASSEDGFLFACL